MDVMRLLKFMGYALIVALLSVTMYSFFLWRGNTSSSIEFLEDQVVFDRLPLGAISEKKVKFRNTSTKAIEIESVRVSCVCTGAHVTRKFLLPGEEGDLVVSLRGHPGMETGEVGTVSCKTNLHEDHVLTLPVVVNSLEGMVIVPSVLDFGLVDPKKLPPTKRVYVMFKTKDIPSGYHVTCHNTSERISIDNYNSRKNETVFKVTVSPLNKSGTFVEFLTFNAKDLAGNILVSSNLSVRYRVN